MNASRKTIVTLSMLWLGFLIFASRDWSHNAVAYVSTKTGHGGKAA